MRTLLVPTDFSKVANNALVYALELALRTGAAVHLLHVVPPAEQHGDWTATALWIEEYLRAKRAHLERTARYFGRKEPFRCVALHAEVRLGFAIEEINACANRIDADLIVMGTTGATGLKRIFLGSTTAAAFARTHRPLLAVPARTKFQPGGKFTFATDFHPRLDRGSLRALEAVLDTHEAELSVIHIAKKHRAELDTANEARFSKMLEGLEPEFHYLEGDDVPHLVAHHLRGLGAHGLVAVSHEHNLLHRLFHDSITRQLAHLVQVPMLVLHDAPVS